MDEFKKIYLGDGLFSLVDSDDYETLKEYTWYFSERRSYPSASIDGKLCQLHRMIMKPTKELVVDHIDGDRLDNRKKNLRICTTQENSYNKLPRRCGSSKYNGVYKTKNSKFYRSRMAYTKDGIRHTFHIFQNVDEKKCAYVFDIVNASVRGNFVKKSGIKLSEQEHNKIFTPNRIKRLENNFKMKLDLKYKHD